MSVEQGDDSPNPTAASKWGRSALECLNVKYDRKIVTDFEVRLALPSELEASIVLCTR